MDQPSERELAAEILRLRDALEAILNLPRRAGIFKCHELARAALSRDVLAPPQPEALPPGFERVHPEPSLGDPRYYVRVRRYLEKRWSSQCAYCATSGVVLEIDHVLPVSRGGSDHVNNLTLACHPCNYRKGTQTADEFGYPGVTIKAFGSVGF